MRSPCHTPQAAISHAVYARYLEPLELPDQHHAVRETYVRQTYPIPVGPSLLREEQPEGYSTSDAMLPQLEQLSRASPLWLNAAGSKDWATLHTAGSRLLGRLEAALHQDAVHRGWLTGQHKPADRSALMEPLSRQHVQHTVLPAGRHRLTRVGDANTSMCCMPIMAESVGRAGQYMSYTAKGYINLDFGQGTLLRRLGRGYRRVPKKRVLLGAHQVVCWLFKGPPPAGMVCAHLCGHPNCINPFHLGYYSPRDNALMRRYHASTGRGHLWPGAS
jgi:hypothetical protein